MSSKSNIYSCVPGCTQKGTVDPEGNRVGFFGLAELIKNFDSNG